MLELSLLNKAKQLNRRNRKIYTAEEIELVKAWLDDEIGIAQMSKVLSNSSGIKSYTFIAFVCRQMLGKNGK